MTPSLSLAIQDTLLGPPSAGDKEWQAGSIIAPVDSLTFQETRTTGKYGETYLAMLVNACWKNIRWLRKFVDERGPQQDFERTNLSPTREDGRHFHAEYKTTLNSHSSIQFSDHVCIERVPLSPVRVRLDEILDFTPGGGRSSRA
ncbi:hypothetical protein CEXT_693451 [Caerostris extrusa]|uniref:Uncharacterized protein n=1 Tax=Caerostris extrusa TaxID=172846 RepID=A0AAV4MBB3_CAEEX|nr:hypothetical protein CEXT_693451 [Caerostris extrusa]